MLRRIYDNAGASPEAGTPVELAWALIETGNYRDAAPLLQANLVPPVNRCRRRRPGIARLPADEHWATGLLLAGQGLGQLLRGELGDGTVAARRGLALEYELGDMGGTAYALGTLGFLASAQGRYQRAALLLGGSAPLWERIGPWYTGTPALVALHRISERAAQDGLGEERYWQLRERASAAPVDQIIRFALADVDDLADLDADTGTCGEPDPRLKPVQETGA